jgi:chemotaxis response regulator CheB
MTTESPPDERPSEGPWVVAIAASAGGVAALLRLFEQLPADFPAAIVVIQHRSAIVMTNDRSASHGIERVN